MASLDRDMLKAIISDAAIAHRGATALATRLFNIQVMRVRGGAYFIFRDSVWYFGRNNDLKDPADRWSTGQ
jgi:hypothetical protein